MLPIRHHNAVSVISRKILATVTAFRLRSGAGPRLDDRWEDGSTASRRFDVEVWRWVRSLLEISIEGSRKGTVVKDLWRGCSSRRIWPNDVAGMLRDEAEYVGADVPAAEGVSVPVGGDSGNL